VTRRIIFTCLLLCSCIFGEAQVSIVSNSANSCTCDGSIVFNNPPLQAEYLLFDSDLNLLNSGNAAGGNFNLNGLCPGVFTLDIIQGTDTASYYVNIPTVNLDPGDAANTSVCSTDGSVNLNTLIAGIAVGGNWSSPGGLSNLAMPLNAEFMEDGWYTYALTSGSCSVVTGVFVDFIENADPGLTTTYEICETYVPFAMIDFMQGDPDPGGQWYNSAGNIIDGFFYPATMNSGLFTYVIDTVQGCSPVFRTMNIDENSQPFAGNDTQISVCEDGVAFDMLQQLTGNPDAGGQWTSPLNTPVGGTFDPSTFIEGTYRYLISANAPCVADQALLTITFLNDDPSGEPSSIAMCENAAPVNMLNSLNGNPTPGGIWTNASGQTVDGTFDPVTENAGVYNYVYPNVGCSPAGTDLTIAVENLNNAGNDNSTSTCQSATPINLNSLLTLGAELGGTWSNSIGQPAGNLFNPFIGLGSYVFNYLITGGLCPSDQATITINVLDAPPQPQNVSIELCSEASPINLSAYYPTIPDIVFENAAGNSLSELFDPGNGSQTIFAVSPSGNGCPDSQGNMDITVIQPVFPQDSIQQNVCNTSIIFDLNNLVSSTAAEMGSWFDANDNSIDSNISLNAEGLYSFRFVLDQLQDCGSSVLFVDLQVFEPLEAGTNGNASFCDTDDPISLAELLPASSSGVGSWSFNGLPFVASSINPSINESGDYYYIVPQNGSCPSDFAILSVNIQPSVDFNAGPDFQICAGENPVQIGADGISGATYSWSPNAFLSSESVSNPMLNIPNEIVAETTISYIVSVVDGLCSTTDSIDVTMSPLPTFDLNIPTEICNGDEITITVDANGDFTWLPAFLFNNQNSNIQVISPDNNVTINCSVATASGCSWSETATVIVNSLPVLQVTPNSISGCPPVAFQQTFDSTSQNIEYVVWQIENFESLTGDTLNAELNASGIYDLMATAYTEEGCEAMVSFEDVIEVFTSPVAQFKVTPSELSTIDPEARFEDLSFDAIQYEWDFAGLGFSQETNPIFEFPTDELANFEVCLRVSNEEGCVDSTCRIVNLNNEHVLFVPNAFTPDNDGLNDIFLPKLKGFDESTYTLQIFDRWGTMIFTTNDIREPWTGDVGGGTHYAKDDVYHWQILVKDKEQADFLKYKGLITLLR
jgi:gliding motility-associated-like protein